MEKFKSYLLIALMALMGGVISSCGSDDDDNNGGSISGDTVGTYILRCTISDYGTLPQEWASVLKQGLEQTVKQEMKNVKFEVAKHALDEAMIEAQHNNFGFGDELSEYDYTIEFYLTDANGKKLYSRYIEVKNGKATLK